MSQSFVMKAQADALYTPLRLIVIWFVQLSLEEGGVKRANIGVLHLPMLALP